MPEPYELISINYKTLSATLGNKRTHPTILFLFQRDLQPSIDFEQQQHAPACYQRITYGGQSELAIFFRFFWQFFSGFHFASFDCVWHPIHAKTGAPKWSHTTVARLLCNMVVDSKKQGALFQTGMRKNGAIQQGVAR